MKNVALFLSIALIVTPDMTLAQQQQDRKATGVQKPAQPTTRPVAPAVQPPRPGGPQIQPPRPGGPQIQPPRPGKPQPPRPIKPTPPRPVKPLPPHRPGAGRPPHFRPIHGPVFRYPHGHHYRRWRVGLLLPRIFLSSRYYYYDYARLRVGAPPYGYRWVRYGPDLLLVRIRTRRVVDVIYGAFY